ncbi:MAG: hypothetical protein R3255_00955 [Candidatus Lokiarchaeia archaeon]|nr:hypothetical protein [Candidatus Lokiarchaeia archaeon]
MLLENIVHYSKKDIDKGNIPLIVYKICSSLREAFCLSYAIRKENNFYLYFQKEHLIIKFEGKNLRFLGPDERSQALLLEKALNKLYEKNGLQDNWTKSTPGIYGKKFSSNNEFIKFFKSISNGKNNLLLDDGQNIENNNDLIYLDKLTRPIDESDFYIIPLCSVHNRIKNIIKLFKGLEQISIIQLSIVKTIEDKILYINFRKDQQGTL